MNFTVASVNYGVPVNQVREVRELQSVTPLPGAPDFVEGVTNLRGQIITVLNLRKRLNLPDDGCESGKIVIVETGKAHYGVMVDSVAEVSTIPGVDFEDHLEITTNNRDNIVGVGKQAEKLVIVLDLAKILSGNQEIPEENPKS